MIKFACKNYKGTFVLPGCSKYYKKHQAKDYFYRNEYNTFLY